MMELRNLTGDSFNRGLIAQPSHSKTTTTILIIMAVVVFLENAAVCFLFASRSKLRTTTNIFVVSMAVSDLLVGVLFVPIYLGMPVNHYVNLYVVTFLLFSSLLNLCGVTYDRYHAILQPLTYHAVFTRRRITIVLVSMWFSPFLFVALPFIWNYQTSEVVITISRIYIGLMVLIVFCTCVVIAKVYYSIFKAIKRQMKMTRHINKMFCHFVSPSTSSTESKDLPANGGKSIEITRPESPTISHSLFSMKLEPNECNARESLVSKLQKLRFKKHTEKFLHDVRASKLFAFIVVIFIFCWLPVVIINFMLAINRVALVPNFIFDISIYAFVANAMANPCIYTFYKSDYRRAFLDTAGCKRERNPLNATFDLLDQSSTNVK